MPSYSDANFQPRAPLKVSNVLAYGTSTYDGSAGTNIVTTTNLDRFRVMRRCAISGISALITTAVNAGNATPRIVAMNGATVLGTLAVTTDTAGVAIYSSFAEGTLAAGDTLSFNFIATGTASATAGVTNGNYSIWVELRELFA